jgi:dynein heavy chain 1
LTKYSVKIQKHLKKMFAGLAAFVLDEEKTTISGMASGEAEVVTFRKTISIKVGNGNKRE